MRITKDVNGRKVGILLSWDVDDAKLIPVVTKQYEYHIFYGYPDTWDTGNKWSALWCIENMQLNFSKDESEQDMLAGARIIVFPIPVEEILKGLISE